MSTSTNNNNQKVTYQLWTDGKRSFAVKKKGEEDSQFEYSDLQEPEKYSKLIDSKILHDASITQEIVQDWIEELKEEGILDQNGNLIYV